MCEVFFLVVVFSGYGFLFLFIIFFFFTETIPITVCQQCVCVFLDRFCTSHWNLVACRTLCLRSFINEVLVFRLSASFTLVSKLEGWRAGCLLVLRHRVEIIFRIFWVNLLDLSLKSAAAAAATTRACIRGRVETSRIEWAAWRLDPPTSTGDRTYFVELPMFFFVFLFFRPDNRLIFSNS